MDIKLSVENPHHLMGISLFQKGYVPLHKNTGFKPIKIKANGLIAIKVGKAISLKISICRQFADKNEQIKIPNRCK